MAAGKAFAPKNPNGNRRKFKRTSIGKSPNSRPKHKNRDRTR